MHSSVADYSRHGLVATSRDISHGCEPLARRRSTAQARVQDLNWRADAAALLGHTVAVHLARHLQPTEKGARAAASGLGAALVGLPVKFS
jgi:hypothetical protein